MISVITQSLLGVFGARKASQVIDYIEGLSGFDLPGGSYNPPAGGSDQNTVNASAKRKINPAYAVGGLIVASAATYALKKKGVI